MALKWAARRQLLYYVVFGVIGAVVLWAGYQYIFSVEASCRNGVEDAGEEGVDCGGVCTLLCAADARPPVVLWARPFKQAEGNYTAVAYVQNNNVGAGAHRVGYTFQLYDADNQLVTDRRGYADLPPTPVVPIFESGINTGTREAARALFAFTDEPVWERVVREIPDIDIKDQKLEAGGNRLSATLVNNARTAARVSTVAVLFNRAGVALAASRSQVTVPARGEEFVVFTWSEIVGVARAEITILPPF